MDPGVPKMDPENVETKTPMINSDNSDLIVIIHPIININCCCNSKHPTTLPFHQGDFPCWAHPRAIQGASKATVLAGWASEELLEEAAPATRWRKRSYGCFGCSP